jgi:putative salt-induced outer membrane protein YdiY
VATSGNSSGRTIGFANDYSKKWDLMTLAVKGKLVQAQNTLTALSAYGASLDDAVVQRTKTTSVTAENFNLSTRFDYRLRAKDRWYWYSEASWEQNLPTGLNSRTSIKAGMGHLFISNNRSSWRADIGMGGTREEPSVRPAVYTRDFGTINVTSNLKHTFNDNVNYNADLSCTYKLENTQDSVYILKHSLRVAMSRRTSLSIGYDMYYRNLPALKSVAVYTEDYPPVALGHIVIRAKKLDTTATTSFVVNF